MAGIAGVNSLAARKQALVAQSELYRQILIQAIEELKVSGLQYRKRFRYLGWLKPLWLIAPLAGSLIGLGSAPATTAPPACGWRKWWGLALIGWRSYQRLAPFIAQFFQRRTSRNRSRHRRFGEFTS